MATYNTIRREDKNDKDKQLQEKLIGQGYDPGSNGADGSYEPKTQAEVQPQVQTPVAAQDPNYRYDPQQDTVYQAALKKLQAAQGNAPTYAGTYDERLQQIYDRIVNRKPFSYDLNGDALWHQYKDQHVQLGQMAAEDAIGQASALTGGYGNSYGQKVGQQTYNQHMQTLTDKIPQLYQLAQNAYAAEGDRLAQQYSMTGQLAADEYAKHQDALNLWQQNLDRAQSEADKAYDRGQSSWYTEQQLKTQADDREYARQQDAYGREQDAYNRQKDVYNRLADLIATTGYKPSNEELTAAGMSAGEAAAYGKYYSDQKKASQVVEEPMFEKYENGKLTSSQIWELQEALGVTPSGKWDTTTMAAANGLLADDAWELYNQGKLGKKKEDPQGISTEISTGQIKGSAWDRTKANLIQLLSNRNYSAAEKYMNQIENEVSDDQIRELARILEPFEYMFE